jgi:acyl-CoA synthetase (AMP-forming)/AMP-acid ligase II
VTEPLRRTGLPASLAHLPATIPAALDARSATPDDDFVIGPDFRLTFGEADSRSFELAGRLLAAGVGKGTRLGLLFANDAAWVVTWLAAARIGALTVPLSTFAPGAELARAIRHTDVHGLLLATSFAEVDLGGRLEQALPGLVTSGPELELDAAPFLRWAHVVDGAQGWSRPLDRAVTDAVVRAAQDEVGPADALAILSTSGATAAPKAVVHTHGSLVRHAAILAERRGLDGADRIYSPMPFFWVGGITMALLAALTSGCGTLCQERFEPGEALDLMERERVTQVQCWPNAARAMAEHPTFPDRDLSSMRGGALVEALPPQTRPPSPDLAPTPLGMTEAGGPHTSHDDLYRPLPEHLRGTFGRSLPGMEHRVVDPATGIELPPNEEGELLLRGTYLMSELYKRERHDTFTPDGWYPTGDLGSLDDEGYVRFCGRMTAMIKSGGSNVAPAEVEAVLAEIPGVRYAHVFGVPAGDRGEDVAAVVVHEHGVALDVDSLVSSARERLSTYKVPKQFRLLAEGDLPMLATGKVDMVALRALF